MPFKLNKRRGMTIRVPLPTGEAYYSHPDCEPVDDQLIPRRILFHSGGGQAPWITMGIELLEGVPVCTYLKFASSETDDTAAAPVRDRHLKMIDVETLVREIVAACAQQILPLATGLFAPEGQAAADQRRVVDQTQRRRDPEDRELLHQVAAIYTGNPDKPIAAVMRELDMSRSTAGRWANRCSDAGLLPAVEKKGKQRV
jgi:hypothetical protein